MNDIKRHETDNLGGINSYIFIPADDVIFIPPVMDGSIRMGIDIKPGARWYQGYGVENTMRFSDEGADSDQGYYFNKKFSAIVPKNRASMVDQINKMNNRKFILILTDNNSEKILAGTIEEPLKFKSMTDTKSGVPERNDIAIEFYNPGVLKSPIFKGLCPLLGY